MNCKVSSLRDLKNIVKCHKSAFPKSLSTKLGNRFISKMMEWYIVSDRGVLFHIEDKNKELIGFCGGIITKNSKLNGAVTSISQYCFNIFVLSYMLKPWLIFHRKNLKKIAYIKKNILIKFRLIKKTKADVDKDFHPFMGLVVICINKENQGLGHGQILLEEFEKKAKEEEIKRITLSVKPNNTHAIKAYKKKGWMVNKQTNDSIQMIKFIA